MIFWVAPIVCCVNSKSAWWHLVRNMTQALKIDSKSEPEHTWKTFTGTENCIILARTCHHTFCSGRFRYHCQPVLYVLISFIFGIKTTMLYHIICKKKGKYCKIIDNWCLPFEHEVKSPHVALSDIVTCVDLACW